MNRKGYEMNDHGLILGIVSVLTFHLIHYFGGQGISQNPVSVSLIFL